MNPRLLVLPLLVTVALTGVAERLSAVEILISSTRSFGGESGIYRINDDASLDPLVHLTPGSGANAGHPSAYSIDASGDELVFSLSGDPGLHRLGADGIIRRIDSYAPAANPNRLVPNLGPQRVTTGPSGDAYLYGDSWQDSYRINGANSVDAAWEESLDALAISSNGTAYAYGKRGLSLYSDTGSLVSTLRDTGEPSSREGALHINDLALDEDGDLLFAARTFWDRETRERTYFLQTFDVSGDEISLTGTHQVDFAIQSLAVDPESGRLFASSLGFVDGVGAVYELSQEGDILDTVATPGGIIWDLAIASDETAAAIEDLSIVYDPTEVEQIPGSGLASDSLITLEQPERLPPANTWLLPLTAGTVVSLFPLESADAYDLTFDRLEDSITFAPDTSAILDRTINGPTAANATQVPEPACLALTLLGIAVTSGRFRRS